MTSPATSWLAAANRADTDFPIQNLPYGAFQAEGEVHLGIAIGDQILDLRAVAAVGLLSGLPEPLHGACLEPTLNRLMALGPELTYRLRFRLQQLLSMDAAADRGKLLPLLRPIADSEMRLPMAIGDYTDFYASIHHATNVGKLFRPANPLLPNYKHLPVGYHGRSSSVVISPSAVRRPWGQRFATGAADGAPPDFGPSRQLDYELEVGFLIGNGNPLGEPIPLAQAEQHIFGLCLVNDWSARDIQRWEYQPLGPFLGKNFATTISPWVVPLEALQPFRVPSRSRPEGDPVPLAYLQDDADRAGGGFDIALEVYLGSRAMRDHHVAPIRLSQSNLRDLYWTMAQMLTHHASNGCNLRSGDLLATGTVSGPDKFARGCLLELASGVKGPGSEPVMLPNGESRYFLEDGDEITLRAFSQRAGYPRIGWGECRGVVLPALLM